MSSAVVANGAAGRLWDRSEVRDKFIHRFLGQFRLVFQSLVEIRHVGRVVFAVVNLHRLGINAGFEGVGGIGQWWKFVSHDFFRLSSRET